MKLHSEEFVQGWMKCKVVANFCDVKIDCPKFEPGKDDKKTEFMCQSPLGVYPCLESLDGDIFGSNSIIRYIASLRVDKNLYGKSRSEHSIIDSYLDTLTTQLEIPLASYHAALLHKKNDKDMDDRVYNDVDTYLKNLNQNCLIKKTFLVENLSIADLAVVCTLQYYLDSIFSQDTFQSSSSIFAKKTFQQILDKYSHVKRWYQTVINQPKWIRTTEEVNSMYSKKIGKTVQSKTAKKEEAKKPAKGETEAGEEEKPKKKENDLDLLPASPLDLNEWKREYSNTKDLYGKAMKWFWEHFDAEGYSLYYMKYEKVEGECNVAFITSNQLGGFLQRLDPSFRKYSFGVIDVVGEEGNFDIQGVWMFRGKDIPFMMKDHVSYEYHQFMKLDHNNPKDKKLVEDYWCACDQVEGKKIADSKVWK